MVTSGQRSVPSLWEICHPVAVVENGKAIGIITERDLVARVLVEGALVQQILAKDVMSSPLVAVGPEASVEEASRIMSQYAIRRLPVVSGEALVGLITSTDIAMQMAKEKQFKDHRLNALAKYCVSPVVRGAPTSTVRGRRVADAGSTY